MVPAPPGPPPPAQDPMLDEIAQQNNGSRPTQYMVDIVDNLLNATVVVGVARNLEGREVRHVINGIIRLEPLQAILTVSEFSRLRMRYELLEGMINDGEYRDLLIADFNLRLAEFIQTRIPPVPPLPLQPLPPPPGGNGGTKRRKSKKKKRTKRTRRKLK